MKSEKKDYLKHWRIVKHYIKVRYGISQQDLEMLLYLYSETYFSRQQFADFARCLSWDKNRLKRLIDQGWIEIFRPYRNFKKAIYTLSYKAKRLITEIYRKLEGEEPLPETVDINPLKKKNLTYADRGYAKNMETMNETIRQRRHHAPE